jgi:hypothetical protein
MPTFLGVQFSICRHGSAAPALEPLRERMLSPASAAILYEKTRNIHAAIDAAEARIRIETNNPDFSFG